MPVVRSTLAARSGSKRRVDSESLKRAGTLYVLAADADQLVVEHTAVFDEELFATPAVLGGTVYLRTKSTLWAFGGGGG